MEHGDLFAQRSRLEKAADRYHKNNPVIYDLFERFALEVFEVSDSYSGSAIWQRIRWHVNVEARDDFINPVTGKHIKMGNNHIAYYVRIFEEKNPGMIGFFEKHEVLKV